MAKRQHKKKQTVQLEQLRAGEVATAERCRQAGGVTVEVIDRDGNSRSRIKRQRVRIECMIDYYWQIKRLTEAQRSAALKFREIYLRVNYGYNTRVLSDVFLMEGTRPDPEYKMLAHIDCVRILNEVYDLLSSAQQEVVRNVCGYDKYAGNKDRLKTFIRGLDKLAKHWGYV